MVLKSLAWHVGVHHGRLEGTHVLALGEIFAEGERGRHGVLIILVPQLTLEEVPAWRLALDDDRAGKVNSAKAW